MVGKIPKINAREGIDEYGRTKIHYASVSEKIQVLIKQGFDVNLQDDNGWCPMHFYAQDRNILAIEVALRNGANPNLVDSHGNSPLWTAIMNARNELACVKALLEAGSNPTHKNSYGHSPLDIGLDSSRAELRNIFEKYDNA